MEGIVLDVGWYRTTIRSFEREVYNIPNSVFSRNVVLNITRKNREWRFFESIGVRRARHSGPCPSRCFRPVWSSSGRSIPRRCDDTVPSSSA